MTILPLHIFLQCEATLYRKFLENFVVLVCLIVFCPSVFTLSIRILWICFCRACIFPSALKIHGPFSFLVLLNSWNTCSMTSFLLETLFTLLHTFFSCFGFYFNSSSLSLPVSGSCSFSWPLNIRQLLNPHVHLKFSLTYEDKHFKLWGPSISLTEA